MNDRLWDKATVPERHVERPVLPEAAVHTTAKISLLSRNVFMDAAAFSILKPADILSVTIVVTGE